MNIRIESGESLDLKPDFKLSIKLNSPLLSEQSSMSLPVTLPESNNKTLGFPDSLAGRYKLRRAIPALIEAGAYNKLALLRLAGYESGTIGALYLNESEMYAKMKEVELSQAFEIVRPASDFHVPGNFSEPLDMMIKYMELVMFDSIQDDFHLFPVATDTYQRTYESRRGKSTVTHHNLLNEFRSSIGYDDGFLNDTDLNGVKYNKLAGRDARTIEDEGKNVDIPKGYGITPFLKQNYILRRIFEYFGYELEESVFDTDPELRKIVVLNNTADAIVREQLNYSQLVPSGTINDYLESVRTDYGCEFFITPDHKSVEVKFWKDILNDIDYIPLDSKVTGTPVLNYVDSKLLKLTNKRGLEGASVNFDTLAKFECNFGKIKTTEKLPAATSNIAPGYYHVLSLDAIYEFYESGNFIRYKFLSPALFDYYEEKKDAEYDTHDMK